MSHVLTRLRLHGFKTFAQRVEIELASNLTAIVGPNGCGKSNLVDALVWALGETNVRTLRAQSPTEVLFSGSATHKPLGLAEVSLWFNNETRWLPLDADEVQITRRLYRSGEWECWINRTPARLRDVADLFAGTGLGRGGYAIIGQGDIEALLNAPPEERRRWLEEVAGIALYRTRRKDALRDLESARMHLTRVEDVLRELERQREPLRQEAERALIYRELQRQLTTLEREWLLYEYHTLRQRLTRAQAERDTLHALILQTELAIAEHEAQAEAHGQTIAQLESAMDTLRTVLQSQLAAEERMLGERSRLEERTRALHELARTLQEEVQSLTAQESERQTQQAALRTALQRLQAEAQAIAPALAEAEAALRHLEARQRALETAYQAAVRQQAEQAQARQQAERLHASITEAQQQLNRLRPQLEALSAELAQARARESALQAQIEALEAEQTQSERTLQTLNQTAQSHTRTVEALRARVRGLEASLQAGEGASPTVRTLLQAVRRGELQGEYVPVGAALSVPEAYQAAISAALGSAANDILTPTEAEARAAVEWLQRNRAGRLTFLPLDLIQPRSKASRAPTTAEGILGVAADLVQYEPRYESAVRYLLGRVLVVDTLERATQLLREWRARRFQGDFSRIATLDGAVVQLSGAITGGASTQERNTLLQLRAELDHTRTELQAAETQRTAAETALEAHRTRHYEQQRLLEHLRQQAREAAQTRLRLESELKQGTREVQHYESLLQDAQEQLAVLNPLLQAQPDADLSAFEAEREQLRLEYETLTHTLAQKRAQSQQLAERQRELLRQLEAETRALEQLQERRAHHLARLQDLQAEQAAIQRRHVEAQTALEQIRQQLRHAQNELETRRMERQHLLEQSFTLNDRVRALRATLSEYAGQERALDLQIARAEVKLAELEDNWRRLAPDEPLPEPEITPPEKPPVARVELERLRRALAEMGEVNPNAPDEYARLNERYTHLERQRNDLEQTCAQLERQLQEIDTHARAQFLKTFEAVRQAFQQRFEQLFEGGQAELILTDERDPLAAGVLVAAQPPNKRRQRLELLSGGERALTAIALLFAFSTVKPSPLMVLDEVDAALDGRNVQRFADYLKQMADRSQILIVTHNPITTAVARQWLGVSMTGGVSRVVPYTPPESLGDPDGLERRRALIQPAAETAPQP